MTTAKSVLATVVFVSLTTFWSLLTLVFVIIQRIKYGKAYCARTIHKRPAVLDDDEWTHDFVQLEDVRLHYVSTGEKGRPLLLFVHGFPEFWYSWRFQLRHFSDQYFCVAVDLRGYGESDRPVGVENYATGTLADDLQKVILKLGYKQAGVVAHDWGAVLAWHLAARHPEVVSKLTIINVFHPRAFPKVVAQRPSQLLKSWYIFMFQVPFLAESIMAARDFNQFKSMFKGRKAGIRNGQNFTDEDLEAWKYTFSQSGACTPPVNFYRALYRYRTVIDRRPIQPPTLILWGTEDMFLDRLGGEISLQHCQQGELVPIEGASHWAQQDEPERVNQELRKFLARE